MAMAPTAMVCCHRHCQVLVLCFLWSHKQSARGYVLQKECFWRAFSYIFFHATRHKALERSSHTPITAADEDQRPPRNKLREEAKAVDLCLGVKVCEIILKVCGIVICLLGSIGLSIILVDDAAQSLDVTRPILCKMMEIVP